MLPHKKQTKQKSIKDKLEARLAESMDEVNNEERCIPDCLTDHIDIRSPSYCESTDEKSYSTTSMARTWFREHSNIDAVHRDFRDSYPEAARHTQSATCSAVIRIVISGRHHHLKHPFNKFKFNSTYHEALGKELLMNPKITTRDDLKTFENFMEKHQLKLCSISMSKNNTVLEDSKSFVQRQNEEEEEDEEEAAELPEVADVLTFKNTERTATATNVDLNEVVTLEDEDATSSEASRNTVAQNQTEPVRQPESNGGKESLNYQDIANNNENDLEDERETDDEDDPKQLPRHLLTVEAEPTGNILQVLLAVLQNQNFVSRVNSYLRETYPLNFSQLWRENRLVIATAYVEVLWTDRIDLLTQLVLTCSQDLQDAIMPLLNARKEELDKALKESTNQQEPGTSSGVTRPGPRPGCKKPKLS